VKFPMTQSFQLTENFLDKYKEVKPPFGFNGLGEFVFMRTYSRLNEDGENEKWWETVKRVVEGIYSIQRQHIEDYNLGWNQAKAQHSAHEMYDRIFNLKMLPSGRSLWAMGTTLITERGLAEALYSCCFLSTKNIGENPGKPFANAMDFLMSGIGVGADVKGAGKVTVKQPYDKVHEFIIPDSREGWVESLQLLINSFFSEKNYEFDYSLIRKAGEPIRTFGGVSSGSKPLIELHEFVKIVLTDSIGKEISSRNIADIFNAIGKAVVAGNVRRCLPKGTLIHTKSGLIKIEDITKNNSVYTSKGVNKVKDIVYQGLQDTIILDTQIGDLECTPNHRVAVLKSPYEYEWKMAKDIKTSDYIVFLENIIEGKKTHLPSFEYKKPKHSTTCQDITVPDLDKDISWILGNLHGNGYVAPNFDKNGFNAYVSFGMSPDYLNMVDFLEKILSRFVTNVKVSYGRKNDRCVRVSSQSKQLVWYFSKFKEAHKEIVIPDFIKQGTKDIRASYLAGLFDADGSSRSRPTVAVATVYPKFAKEVQSLYASLGIPTRIKSKNRDKYGWKTICNINIVGEKSKIDFENVVMKYSLKYKNTNKTNRSGNDFTFSKQFLKNSGIKTSTPQTLQKFNERNLPTKLIPVKIKGVKNGRKNVETYDIEVENIHEFICNQGFLVHNSAEILIGDYDDQEFMELKDYEKNPDRASLGWASNNSVYADIGMDYSDIAKRVAVNAEPGILWLDNAQQYSRMNSDERNNKDRRVLGVNPCFTYSSNILTANGYKEIGSLDGKTVQVYDKNGIIVDAKIFKTGDKETIELELSNNQVIKCTPEHIFMTINGEECMAKNLDGKFLMPYKDNENKYVSVIELNDNGIESVYDFSIDGDNHWGVIDGFVVHNCGEITLESSELCNLVETFPNHHESLEDYQTTLKFAYLYAKSITLLNTHWPETNRVMLRNRRIGISMSGIAQFISNRNLNELKIWMEEGYKTAKYYDRVYSEWLAIPESIKMTTIKPSGTASLLAGATPGIHFPESKYYIRRVRLANDSSFIKSLKKAGYNVEAAFGQEDSTSVVEFPIFAGENVRTIDDVSMWEQLGLAAFAQKYWSGNSVSITVTFDKDEEKDIKNALNIYQFQLKAVSFLPKLDSSTYPQMPYEAITKEVYESMSKKLKPLNFSKVTSEAIGEKYCTNDSCTI